MSRKAFHAFYVAAHDWLFEAAAQLAYWSMLALFPFAIVLLTLLAFLPLPGMDKQLTRLLGHVLPAETSHLFNNTIQEVVGRQHGWLLALSLVAALWIASGGVSALASALNRAWGIKETRPYWKIKLLSIAMTIVTILLTAMGLALFLLGPMMIHQLTDWAGARHTVDLLWRVLRWPAVVSAMTAMLSMMYWVLPNRKSHYYFWSRGSLLATLAWILVSMGFRAYVAHVGSYSRLYGTLGAGIALMTWLFLSGVVVILGGLYNAVHAQEALPLAKKQPDSALENG